MEQKRRSTPSRSHKLRHRTRGLIVPHRGNQYRPYLVRSSAVLGIFLIALVLPLLQNLFQTGSILGRVADISPETLLQATNSEREAHQASPLRMNEKLTTAAQLKARDMIEKQYWAHASADGIQPWHWFEKADYHYEVAGENLAKNFATDGATVAAWMNSLEHRKNVLDPRFKDVGFAVVQGELEQKPITIIVAMYGVEVASFAQVAAETASRPAVLAATSDTLGPLARVDIGLHSLTSTALVSLGLLMLVVGLSVSAHAYRKKLPKPILRSWRKHHGIYKAMFATLLGVVVVILFGTGQL